MSTLNDALNDECEALNSIYGDNTIAVTDATPTHVLATLKFPNQPFSFRLEFPTGYPDVPLQIVGTQSTGNTAKGAGEAAVLKLLEVFGNIYTPGQVCLFDLIEETGPGLEDIAATFTQQQHGEAEDPAKDAAARSAQNHHHVQEHALTVEPAARLPAPAWTTTEAFTANKSVFVGRACAVTSMDDVTDAIGHLLSTNKKVATATHNIKAWRIKNQTTNAGFIQDYDDDGESAAGGRMLHLMQLMDVYGLVVVTRWYGGVKLGPDRFRVINNVAREALTLGGFVREEKIKSKK